MLFLRIPFPFQEASTNRLDSPHIPSSPLFLCLAVSTDLVEGRAGEHVFIIIRIVSQNPYQKQ